MLPEGLRPILRGLVAYGLAEAGSRILRVFAIIVIARQVPPAQIGVAALALAVFEIVRVLANSGIGQRIIAASDAELPGICNAAHRLFYIWCTGVALVQLIVAAIIWLAFAQGEIALMLVVLTGVYALMPGGLVRVFLLMRDGRLGTTARIGAAQTMLDHALSMALALAWPSAWAIVLPKLLTAPVWLILVRRARKWSPAPGVTPAPARQFMRFGAGVLGTELVVAARQQLDKVVIGALLGTEALGYYYFAFNAGVGITNSFIAALSIVLFPQLCSEKDNSKRRQRLIQATILSLVLFVPIIAAQVLLADIYVPLLFGAQWTSVAPLVAILCLAGIPAIFGALCTAWLRATGQPERDAAIALAASAGALLALCGGTSFGLTTAAWAYVAALWLIQVPIAFVILFRLPGRTSPTFPQALNGASS
ncbi:hypothetical protein AAV99_01645 [Aurantiacibacter marinus]|uniref:Polysaccharide biosynthesis protein n=2 Tax=Aurantiacibacter marinus TaxID=874156 RepID=A0A0H0XR82_9SPHN|nr:hypothetical protein AAV99_01645 [Aurantiacibacter marinus]